MPKMNKGFFSSGRRDYETPPWIFDRLNAVFHFNLDVCANARNTKVPANYITEEEDGLTLDWGTRKPEGDIFLTAWMNPEYGTVVGDWIEKAVEEWRKGHTVVGLLGARTDAGWFHDYVYLADNVLFLRGRLKFLLPCTHCGKSTDRRRRPSDDIIVKLDEEHPGYADDNNLWGRGTLPVCNTCAKIHLSSWHEKSSNSPAMGSQIVMWGYYTPTGLAQIQQLADLGLFMKPMTHWKGGD